MSRVKVINRVWLKNVDHLIGREVICTEKLDGENTSLFTNHLHARSEDSNHHDSQGWVRNFHAKIAWKIPEYIQIVGENVYAKHSIYYNRLTTFFYGFTAIDLKQQCFLSVDATMELFNTLGIEYVPVLYRGSSMNCLKLQINQLLVTALKGML